MVYLEYDVGKKQVVEIHSIVPTQRHGYDYAITDEFVVGDEFELTIWINGVDENKHLLSHAAIRNNPNATRLLQENAMLKAENILLKVQNQELAERTDFHEDLIAEMAMMLYP